MFVCRSAVIPAESLSLMCLVFVKHTRAMCPLCCNNGIQQWKTYRLVGCAGRHTCSMVYHVFDIH